MKTLRRAGFGVWCWVVFLPVVAAVLLLALPAPEVVRRRRIARTGARLFFVLAGIRLRVTGLERLPAGASVVVANHTSYVDGLIMQAALPPSFAFVIKKEMVRVPLASLLLRRLGAHFVERYDRRAGAADARRLLRSAAGGQSLAFFPEGTFVPRVGLGRFHAGAFVAAARAGLPLVPVAIRGARVLLPPSAALPRHTLIEVDILRPLEPASRAEPDGAGRLRRQARAAILAAVGEPDLEA